VTTSPSAEDHRAINRLLKGFEHHTVIPVVGAGVSHQAAGRPLWADVLPEALRWCETRATELGRTRRQVADLNHLTQNGLPTLESFEIWARRMFCNGPEDDHWTHPQYAAWLQATFGGPWDVVDDTIYKALQAIDPRVIVTTNYDRYLTEVAFPKREAVTWGNRNTILQLFRERPGVFHLHGVFDEPGSVILTTTDYERIINADANSDVASQLSSQGILLFMGVSPEGATDRHLGRLLRLGQLHPSDGPHPAPTHVLLHAGTLSPEQVARLRHFDIHPLSYGDGGLGPFLRDLTRPRAERQDAAKVFGLNQLQGDSLRGSGWDPTNCMRRVDQELRFMGWRSSKWVSREALRPFEKLLQQLGSWTTDVRVRFLIVNPKSRAWERLKHIRGYATMEHISPLQELAAKHECFSVACLDHLPAFRLTAVDNHEVGLALYPTSPLDRANVDKGWAATHYSLERRRPESLGRSMVFMFDELFRSATSLGDAMAS
jgi:hypothetical protein